MHSRPKVKCQMPTSTSCDLIIGAEASGQIKGSLITYIFNAGIFESHYIFLLLGILILLLLIFSLFGDEIRCFTSTEVCFDFQATEIQPWFRNYIVALLPTSLLFIIILLPSLSQSYESNLYARYEFAPKIRSTSLQRKQDFRSIWADAEKVHRILGVSIHLTCIENKNQRFACTRGDMKIQHSQKQAQRG
ncbi:hypothetical protein CC78DRAFT_295994 [Lojkania enalia]|uniref:Uncharacterized protein n=1 Tax=Lojkania enalia TaxID=147567 RepID=A0A9P4KA41_9PLEO|nr:hypothetical protein CC78DRAFT_295994 [Didymosphaeria enalia]